MAIVGFVTFLIMMPIGAQWGAWHYDYSKTSNIRIGSELLETFIWQILSCMILAVVVDHFAEREEKKKPFWHSGKF